ncbi:hypothetical protein [Rhizobium phage RHEph16]|uniref:Uncharacterized protein n=1 Tax=Rhizobium phage RHEph16 TaxID=2836132 RepID=A0AAE7VMA3_9CAUD|nr:hypothetical protein PP750_gp90 [Rhizobium phage RHEph16]QXV74401.1 hypothetical protein [Rhizobium phage RHEph16]
MKLDLAIIRARITRSQGWKETFVSLDIEMVESLIQLLEKEIKTNDRLSQHIINYYTYLLGSGDTHA